jgi:hypothetical protein
MFQNCEYIYNPRIILEITSESVESENTGATVLSYSPANMNPKLCAPYYQTLKDKQLNANTILFYPEYSKNVS